MGFFYLHWQVQWRLIHRKYPLTIGKETWTSDKDISVFYTRYNDTDEGWDLVIKEAKPRHTNTYECQISTMKSNRRYVHLTVLGMVWYNKYRKTTDLPQVTGKLVKIMLYRVRVGINLTTLVVINHKDHGHDETQILLVFWVTINKKQPIFCSILISVLVLIESMTNRILKIYEWIEICMWIRRQQIYE